MSRFVALTVACGLLVASVLPAHAARKFPTKYTYYVVTGSSAAEIYKSLGRKGPVFHGMRAYASTAIANPRQSGKLVSNGKMCRVQSFSFNTDFVINLPRLKDPSALHGVALRNWHKFHAFAKRHEEQHRSIWLSCWASYNAEVSALHDKTCPGLERKIENLLKTSVSSCEKRHQSLDTSDQVALKNQPFIRQSLDELAN